MRIASMIFAGCLGLALVAGGACTSDTPHRNDNGDTGMRDGGDQGVTTLTGTLEGGYAGIGGEHTGWMLMGTERGDIEINVSNVWGSARDLSGSRVRVTGEVIQKDYLERGPTPILVAESIERA